MRPTSWLVFTIAAAAACGGASGSGAGAAPKPAAATAAPAPAAGAASNPCSSGNCKVTVEMDETVSQELSMKGAAYHVYAGCPRTLGANGVNDSLGIRASTPVMPAQLIPVFAIPPSMKGNIATISMWWGAQPHRYVVVDFSKGTTQVVNFGYRWDGTNFLDDVVRVNNNTRSERNICH